MITKVRHFDISKDQAALEDICANVYGGSDYLPSEGKNLAEDPNCSFLVLASEYNDKPLAVANHRRINSSLSWLECVRTCEQHRGKGLATKLIRNIVEESLAEGRQLMSCTVSSNTAMMRVFEKFGMTQLCRLRSIKSEELREQPGWSPGDERFAQPILKTFGLEQLVSERARNAQWNLVKSNSEIGVILEMVGKCGGNKNIPGLYEILDDSTKLMDALTKERIYSLRWENDEVAMIAMVLDDRINSLRSKWVCSIIATSSEAFDSALWHSCSAEVLHKLNADVAFHVVFDDAVPLINGSIASSLPLVTDPCVLYGKLK